MPLLLSSPLLSKMSFSLFFLLKLKHFFELSVVHLEIHHFLFSWSIIRSPGQSLSCSLNWNCLACPIVFRWLWKSPVMESRPTIYYAFASCLTFLQLCSWSTHFPRVDVGDGDEGLYVIEKPSEKFFFIPSCCTLEATETLLENKKEGPS